MLVEENAKSVYLDWRNLMLRTKYECDLTGIRADQSSLVLRKNSVHFIWYVEGSAIFGGSCLNNWNGFSASHSWGKFTFRHVGSIWGRPPETNTKLIINI